MEIRRLAKLWHSLLSVTHFSLIEQFLVSCARIMEGENKGK